MGQSGVAHDFRERLAWSEAGGHEAFWDAVYKKAFPNLVNHMLCSGDTQSQRMGIDRLLILANGMTIAIDEKKRSEVYADVLLEYISIDTTGAPGWIEKDLAIDYLAYAFLPTKKCYLFPWQLLRRVWLERGEKWKQWAARGENGFRLIRAQNRTYQTHSVAVPLKSLLKAIEAAAVIDVSQELAG